MSYVVLYTSPVILLPLIRPKHYFEKWEYKHSSSSEANKGYIAYGMTDRINLYTSAALCPGNPNRCFVYDTVSADCFR